MVRTYSCMYAQGLLLDAQNMLEGRKDQSRVNHMQGKCCYSYYYDSPASTSIFFPKLITSHIGEVFNASHQINFVFHDFAEL